MDFLHAVLAMTEGNRVRRKAWSAFALQAFIMKAPATVYRPAVFIDCDDGQRLHWRPRPADYEARDWIIVDQATVDKILVEFDRMLGYSTE
jgi:hypothetical protein